MLVCHRCGSESPGAGLPCPACGREDFVALDLWYARRAAKPPDGDVGPGPVGRLSSARPEVLSRWGLLLVAAAGLCGWLSGFDVYATLPLLGGALAGWPSGGQASWLITPMHLAVPLLGAALSILAGVMFGWAATADTSRGAVARCGVVAAAVMAVLNAAIGSWLFLVWCALR